MRDLILSRPAVQEQFLAVLLQLTGCEKENVGPRLCRTEVAFNLRSFCLCVLSRFESRPYTWQRDYTARICCLLKLRYTVHFSDLCFIISSHFLQRFACEQLNSLVTNFPTGTDNPEGAIWVAFVPHCQLNDFLFKFYNSAVWWAAKELDVV